VRDGAAGQGSAPEKAGDLLGRPARARLGNDMVAQFGPQRQLGPPRPPFAGVLVGRGAVVAAVFLVPPVAKGGVVEVAPDFAVDGRAVPAQLRRDHRHRHLGITHLLNASPFGQIDVRILPAHPDP